MMFFKGYLTNSFTQGTFTEQVLNVRHYAKVMAEYNY